jgi:hypothetical protein
MPGLQSGSVSSAGRELSFVMRPLRLLQHLMEDIIKSFGFLLFSDESCWIWNYASLNRFGFFDESYWIWKPHLMFFFFCSFSLNLIGNNLET